MRRVRITNEWILQFGKIKKLKSIEIPDPIVGDAEKNEESGDAQTRNQAMSPNVNESQDDIDVSGYCQPEESDEESHETEDFLSTVEDRHGRRKYICYEITVYYHRDRIVPSDQLHRFSASQFPQYPQISFPAALINSPVALFLKCLDAPGIEPSRLEVTVSSIFKAHLDNVFAAARSKIVKRCRTGDAEQPSTSA
uniref:Uncharacterized protein n=2 Tax=Caenorhabditis japonica TaxID=281687 RepID=A0A8R1EEG9_CAEJA